LESLTINRLRVTYFEKKKKPQNSEFQQK
jgi:hypothetical protein